MAFRPPGQRPALQRSSHSEVIAVFAAMQSEVSVCLQWAKEVRSSEVDGLRLSETDGMVVCQTGIGPRSRDAAESVVSRISPGVVLSIGVAGGLSPKHAVGDVILCERIDHESHRGGEREDSVFSDPRLVEAALAAGKGLKLPIAKGSSLTVDEAAWGPAEKAEHHSWRAHDLAEMESYWIGEVAARHNLPFLAIRSISDHAGDELIKTGAVGLDGNFHGDRLIAYVREHPDQATAIAAQGEAARSAFNNLAILCAALLPPLVQHFAG